MNECILVVDDEREIADVIELYLQNDQYTVYKFYTGQEALDCIFEKKIDLAILDVMLPDIDGFQILKKIREKYTFPVIMLTAKTEYMDKITGLTLGADDYIPKPFNPLELVASLCGFSGANYFCRVFRRSTGLTPAAWRKANRGACGTPAEADALERGLFV